MKAQPRATSNAAPSVETRDSKARNEEHSRKGLAGDVTRRGTRVRALDAPGSQLTSSGLASY